LLHSPFVHLLLLLLLLRWIAGLCVVPESRGLEVERRPSPLPAGCRLVQFGLAVIFHDERGTLQRDSRGGGRGGEVSGERRWREGSSAGEAQPSPSVRSFLLLGPSPGGYFLLWCGCKLPPHFFLLLLFSLLHPVALCWEGGGFFLWLVV